MKINLYLLMMYVVNDIDKMMGDECRQSLLQSDYNELYLYNSLGLGIWIREHILTEESVLVRLFRSNGITHSDDMSMLIVLMLYYYEHAKK